MPLSLQLEVLEKSQCEAMNMGLFLGVSECSDQPPKFIHLKYTPKGEGGVERERYRSQSSGQSCRDLRFGVEFELQRGIEYTTHMCDLLYSMPCSRKQ